MKINIAVILPLAMAFCFSSQATGQQEVRKDEVKNAVVEPFELVDTTGANVELVASDETRFTVVCFTGNECPLARLYAPRLNSIAAEFADAPVSFVCINSNVHDSAEEIKEFVDTFELAFSLVADPGNRVADNFNAQRTPEVFVVDNELRVRYRGRIDDQYQPGISRPEATKNFLRDAITALLTGHEPDIVRTNAMGCIIGRARTEKLENAEVTYCNQIARLLQTHCVECHRSGQIGPFDLTDYDEVVGWADMMMEVVDEGRMPPWHADPDFGAFVNARHISEEDTELLREWIDSGTPYGDVSGLPQPQSFTQGWRLPAEPDVVLQMSDKPFTVPAEGTVEYQYFVVQTGFAEDKWVQAAEVIPGNHRVVHHAIVFIRPPDGADFVESGWLGAYVPGQGLAPSDPAMARKIPAGSTLVFQMHYTPTGVECEDITKIGIVFADRENLSHELVTLIGVDQEFEIPPHASDYEVSFSIDRFPANGRLLSVSPHMHWRGKSFEFSLTGSDDAGSSTLLKVPAYDFNWQHDYQFTEPVSLEGIRQFDMKVTFDNSKDNPVNPDPGQYVTWGDQTWEEMAVAFFNVARPLRNEIVRAELMDPETGQVTVVVPLTSSTDNGTIDMEAVREQWSEEKRARIQEFTNDFFERFDTNQDGLVAEDETPRAISAFSYDVFDNNLDGFLTREEVELQASMRFR